MKLKILVILILITASGLFLASCSSDNDVGGNTSPVAVQFVTGNIASAQLRTTSGGNQWKIDDPIGIFMFTAGTNSLLVENVPYKASIGNNNVSGFIPVGSTPIYYPPNGKVDFIAYYPYEINASGSTATLDVKDQSDAGAIDVLYSNNATNKDKNSGTVDLQFIHVLAKLSFRLQSGVGAPNLTGATVKISNLETRGYLKLVNGEISVYSDTKQTITANGLTSSAIVIPQTFSGSKLIVTLTDGSTFEWEIDHPSDKTFMGGMNYSYTIIVDKTGITVTPNGIAEWKGTDTPPTQGTAEQGEYYPVKHSGWAGSNIYYNGTHLTFADTGDNTKQDYQGVYFQFGSLYGISPKDDYSTSTVLYPPDGSSIILGMPWNAIPRVGDNNITGTPPQGKTERDRAYLYEITNGTAGIGDICKWLTFKGWAPAGKKWRMPTSMEFEDIDDVNYGGSSWSGVISTQADGTFTIDRGKDSNGTHFPAAGDRYSGSGALNGVGSYGYYWTATVTGTSAYNLIFNSSTVLPSNNNNNRANGFSVRCVRESV